MSRVVDAGRRAGRTIPPQLPELIFALARVPGRFGGAPRDERAGVVRSSGIVPIVPSGTLPGKIRSSLISQPSSRESPLVTEFRSGRRRYLCRTFLVDWYASGPSHPSIAVLLERGPSGLIPLSHVSEQFNLTQRERGALEYLMQGLSSKEIATRMNVSPNTVKAFLRLVMIKMGVSSRSAIVGKVMMTRP